MIKSNTHPRPNRMTYRSKASRKITQNPSKSPDGQLNLLFRQLELVSRGSSENTRLIIAFLSFLGFLAAGVFGIFAVLNSQRSISTPTQPQTQNTQTLSITNTNTNTVTNTNSNPNTSNKQQPPPLPSTVTEESMK